jgi:hypothetical protein
MKNESPTAMNKRMKGKNRRLRPATTLFYGIILSWLMVPDAGLAAEPPARQTAVAIKGNAFHINGHLLAEITGGWTSLFDGKSLAGWNVRCVEADRDKSFWSVEDGSMVCDSLAATGHDYVWLVSDKEYQDFELQLKVRSHAASPGNSGIQIRSRFDEAAGWLDGPQVDLHPPGGWRSGLIYDETRGHKRWIFPSLKDSRIEPGQGPQQWKWNRDGWNDVVIRCHGTKILTTINGLVIADYDGAGVLDDEAHRKHGVGMKGFIALQLHKNDRLRIAFKDILIRPAPH